MKKLILALMTGAALLPAVPAFASCDDCFAKKAGDFMIRGRAIVVAPVEDIESSVNGSLDIDNSVVPELDFTYFFTDHIAAELIAGVTPHDVKLNDSTLGDLDLGSAWLLPPTLTVQYHFDPVTSARLMPYVGVGLNYTRFFGADDWVSPVGKVTYDDSIGGALQAGVDVPLSQNWAFNMDVKKIWIKPDVKVVTVSNARVDANVDINPWVVGVGFAYKF